MLRHAFNSTNSRTFSRGIMTAFLSIVLTGCGIAEMPDDSASRVPFEAPETVAEREDYTAIFGVLVVPGQGKTLPRYVTATIRPPIGRWDHYTVSGTGAAYPFEVIVRPGYRNSWSLTQIEATNPSLVARIDGGTATARDVVTFASLVSRSTFCRGGTVTENQTAGRVVRNPADIAAIVSASATAPGQRDTVPDTIEGSVLRSVERIERDGWLVRLRCSLWRSP